jgi:hypothetical protein
VEKKKKKERERKEEEKVLAIVGHSFIKRVWSV